MRRELAALTVLSATLVLANCHSSNSPQQPVQQVQTSPLWKLTLQSSCPDTAIDQCVAGYGFAVDSNGKFVAGPGPGGQISTGTVSSDELGSLGGALAATQNWNQLLDSALPESCISIDNGDGAPTSDDTLTLSHYAQSHIILHTKGTQACIGTANSELVTALHGAVKVLANKYYTLPFPDPCAEAAAAVEAVYNGVRGCQSAADCAYFDLNYDPIAPGSDEYVVTDSCSMVKPLVVANINAAVNAQAKIQEAMARASDTCGGRIVRADCTGYSGFQSGSLPPACVSNVCQANSSANHP